MQFHLRRFCGFSLALALLCGCNRASDPAENGPFATDDTTPGRGAFSTRMARFEESGDYLQMVAAAQTQLRVDSGDVTAQYALARGTFYNADFPLAITQLEKLTQTPSYAQNAEALELLRIARFLGGKYANQKFAPVQSVQSDIATLSQQERERGAALINAKKYDEIEAVAAQLTRNPTIMSDGGWTLAPFYVGLWDGAQESQTETQWQKRHAQIEAWHRARPQSQLARICLARSWTNGAWLARGDEFADKVSDAAWKIVEDRQAKAAPIYEQLLKEKATSPLVYAAAQRYGRLGGAPRQWHDALFARAVAQFPNYTDFHRERAIFLLPRWDGAPGEWEKELQKSADSEVARAGAEAGDRLYARVVWGQWSYYKNMRRETKIDWPRTARGFDSILAQTPDSLAVATIYMRLAYQWGESTKARQWLQKVGGRADDEIWDSPRRFAQARIDILRLLP